MFQAMDQDIYNAVMGAKAARERVVAGGSTQSDDALADDEPVKPMRTRKEALQATLIVLRVSDGWEQANGRKAYIERRVDLVLAEKIARVSVWQRRHTVRD